MFHDSEKVEFGYRVLKKFQGDPLGRQIDEAIRIEDESGNERMMNNKLEWVRPAVVRIAVERM